MIKRKVQSSDDLLRARILYYDFFAGLFLYDLLESREEILKNQLSILLSHPLIESNQLNLDFLHNEVLNNGVRNLLKEYTHLFMLPFSIKETNHELPYPSIVLYLSYYLDGSIAGSGLTLSKSKIKKSKFRLNEKSFKENEEHFGFLILFMKHLLQNNEESLFREVFKECLSPMYFKIIEGMLNMDDSFAYFHVASLLKTFLELEDSICN